MRIGISLHRTRPNTDLEPTILKLIKDHGFVLDNENPDVVISVGGDGTFLRTVQKYACIKPNIVFIGINEGSLGYFCDFVEDDLELIFDKISKNELTLTIHHLLKAELNGKEIYSVNEICIDNPQHTIGCEVYINDELLEVYHGNGILVSSSLGSTAYNRSIGGAIVDYNNEMLELTEIAPLRSNAFSSLGSSLILNKDTKILLKGKFHCSCIGYDSFSINNDDFDEISFCYSDKTFKFAHKDKSPFISSMRRSFIKLWF